MHNNIHTAISYMHRDNHTTGLSHCYVVYLYRHIHVTRPYIQLASHITFLYTQLDIHIAMPYIYILIHIAASNIHIDIYTAMSYNSVVCQPAVLLYSYRYSHCNVVYSNGYSWLCWIFILQCHYFIQIVTMLWHIFI